MRGWRARLWGGQTGKQQWPGGRIQRKGKGEASSSPGLEEAGVTPWGRQPLHEMHPGERGGLPSCSRLLQGQRQLLNVDGASQGVVPGPAASRGTC